MCLADAVAAALAVPLATDLHDVHFAPDAYWRGETHGLCDRAGSLERLLHELAELAVDGDSYGVGGARVAPGRTRWRRRGSTVAAAWRVCPFGRSRRRA